MSKLNNLLNKFLGETSKHLVKTFFVYGFIALSIIIIKILIAQLYGQEELGYFTYFFSLVSFVFLFTSFGILEALTQTIIKEPKKLRSLLIIIIPLVSISTVFFLLITILITETFNLNPPINNFWLLIVAYVCVTTLFYLLYSMFKGIQRFVEGATYSLINRVIFIVFIIFAFIYSLDFFYVLLSFSVAILISFIFGLPRIKKFISPENFNVNLKKFLYLSISLFLMQVGFYSLRFLSEIIIGVIVDFNSLGLYSANSSITNVIRLIAYVFPVVVLPMAVISKYKLRKSVKKIILLLIPFSSLVLVSTYVLVPLLYGQEYVHLTLPIILTISSSLLVLYSYFNSIFVGENNFSSFYVKIILIDFILSLVLNTILNVVMISSFGIIGAPIATSITIIFKIALNVYAIKKLRIRKKLTKENDNT